MTAEKQSTAVEWIEQEILKGELSLLEIIKQAKEMHKQEIINAFECIDLDEDYRGEQYYNEIFKSE